jgi:hypothetical protein
MLFLLFVEGNLYNLESRYYTGYNMWWHIIIILLFSENKKKIDTLFDFDFPHTQHLYRITLSKYFSWQYNLLYLT